jgi:signal transduction histidine kinase
VDAVKVKKPKMQQRALGQRDRYPQNPVVTPDEFLSVASHELRTPLTSLRLEVANLLRLARRNELTADARLVARVEKIDAQTARLHRLIDELLDASRIAAGRLELELEEMNLAEVVEEVGLRFREEAARLGCVLGVRAPLAVVGYWDRGRVDQVVSNLVANAIKYGEGKPIEVSVDTTDDRALVMVRDSGVGIALPDHERIFGRFERAVSSRNYGGIGVGLWTVKQIVDALAGTVTVDSQPGMGATFTVALPRARASGAAARFGASLGEREVIAREATARVRS